MHTPGPWRLRSQYAPFIVDPGDGRDPWIACSASIMGGDNGRNVADVKMATNHSGYPGVGLEMELRGNVNLIVAAPEMLDILVELQECAQYWSEYDVPIGIVDRLNAVIEKAKGDVENV